MLPQYRSGAICLLTASILAAGCIRMHSTTAPDPAPLATAQVQGELALRHHGKGWHNFYPLHVGNRWIYARSATFESRPIGAPSHRDSFHSTIERRQTCYEMAAGRRYVIERVRETSDEGTNDLWVRLRQDRAGLYERDETGPPSCEEGPLRRGGPSSVLVEVDPSARLLVQVPLERRAAWAAAAARNGARMSLVREILSPRMARRRGGVAPGEIQILQYPLHPGASWVVREDPLFTYEVVRHERLVTPAGRFSAYRIRVQSEFFEPRDRVFLWFSREGFLQLEVHLEAFAIDESGNVAGVLVSDDRQTLTGLSLVGRGPHDNSESMATREPPHSGW